MAETKTKNSYQIFEFKMELDKNRSCLKVYENQQNSIWRW